MNQLNLFAVFLKRPIILGVFVSPDPDEAVSLVQCYYNCA